MAEDNISKFLGMRTIDEVIENKNEIIAYKENLPTEPIKVDPRKEEDFESARDTLTNILAQSSKALDEMFNLAEQSQNPIAYEKLGALINSVTAVSKTLMDIHVKKKTIDKVEVENPALKEDNPNEVHNHIHVGSTAELARLLEEMKNERPDK